MINVKDIPNGEYVGLLTDWKLSINPYLNSPEVSLKFEFDVQGEIAEMTFKSLWFTRSGTPNKKTQDAIAVCGWDSSADPRTFEQAQLDTAKEYALTIGENDKGYKEIQWVNDPNDAGRAPPQATKSLEDFFAPKVAALKPGNSAKPSSPSPGAKPPAGAPGSTRARIDAAKAKKAAEQQEAEDNIDF